jgi:hypothetical protein
MIDIGHPNVDVIQRFLQKQIHLRFQHLAKRMQSLFLFFRSFQRHLPKPIYVAFDYPNPS